MKFFLFFYATYKQDWFGPVSRSIMQIELVYVRIDEWFLAGMAVQNYIKSSLCFVTSVLKLFTLFMPLCRHKGYFAHFNLYWIAKEEKPSPKYVCLCMFVIVFVLIFIFNGTIAYILRIPEKKFRLLIQQTTENRLRHARGPVRSTHPLHVWTEGLL